MSDSVDLHCHSSCSGGAIGMPTIIPGFFKDRGYRAFALCEHDNIDSFEPARKAAGEAGIEIIRGLEVSTVIDDERLGEGIVHILAYMYEATDELIKMISRNDPHAWVKEALSRLRKMGVADIREKEIQEHIRKIFGPDDVWKNPWSIGPVGDLLYRHGVSDKPGPDAARKILGDVYPASERESHPCLTEVIQVLRRAGAVTIPAHPGGGKDGTEEERELLAYWLDNYVHGLEVFTPKNSESFRTMAYDLVRDLDRPFTGGSDTHAYNEHTPVTFAGYECVVSLRDWKKRPFPI